MTIVSIAKKEYERLKRYSSAYLRIAEELASAERAFPYDYSHLNALTKKAMGDHKKGRSVEAESVDEVLTKFRKK